VKFKILTVVTTNLTIFWNQALRSLVERYRRFRGTCCFYMQDKRVGRVDSGCIAAGLSTYPCCLGIEPCLGSLPECDIQQTFVGLLHFGSSSQSRRWLRRVNRCKRSCKYSEGRPSSSHDEPVDSLKSSGESSIFCLQDS
jgi:hypothetical protein